MSTSMQNHRRPRNTRGQFERADLPPSSELFSAIAALCRDYGGRNSTPQERYRVKEVRRNNTNGSCFFSGTLVYVTVRRVDERCSWCAPGA